MRKTLAVLLLLPIFLTACDSDPAEPLVVKSTIEGTITYRERMALSEGAIVTIALEDVSRADAASITLAEAKIANPGQVPIEFSLEYSSDGIDERMSYAIRAQIYDHDRLLFTTDTHTPVLTRGAGNHVEMTLVRVNPPTVSPPEKPMAEPAMKLEGMFRYMADAALFRDCRNNKAYPVSMEGAYIELERAYLGSGVEAGEEVMVQLDGRLLERPAMEGNHNEVKLIVDSFKALLPENTCEPMTHSDLQNTYWKLLEVDGSAVAPPEGRKEAHLILSTAELRAHGNAGCNNFFGQYRLDGEKLTFSPAMASTMMACPDGMDTEQAFLGALGKTTRYTISGLFLELYAEDTLLARFEAVYL